MSRDYEHSIFQGETLYIEFVLRDEAGEYEDLSTATPSVITSAGLDDGDIVVAKTGGSGSIDITALAADTECWPVGVYNIQLILTWNPIVTIGVEKAVGVRLTVKEALDA